MRTFFSGKDNPIWRGGKIKRKSNYNWQMIRRKVLQRDNLTCQDCGYVGKLHKRIKIERSLVAHHINGFRYEKWNKDDIKKLITLCSSCHPNAEQKLLRKHSKYKFKHSRSSSASFLSLRGVFSGVFNKIRRFYVQAN